MLRSDDTSSRARDTLEVEWVPADRLYCNPKNPRHNAAGIPHVAASLRRFGWRQPIVAKRSGELVAGNTRLLAARALGMKEVPVVWFEGGKREAVAYSIADNRTHEYSEWDELALAELLSELRDEDALEGVGYTEQDLDELLAELEDSPADLHDPGPEAPPADPVTCLGDLWVLGDHRLLCGSATEEADVLRLMNGDVAALFQTDPPYLVDYTGADRPNDSGKDWSDRYREVEIRDAERFFGAVFRNALEATRKNAAWYCWHAHKRAALIEKVWAELGVLNHQQIIWVKPTALHGFSFWPYRHEPCLMGWRKGHKPDHDGDNSHEITTVWEIDWEGKARVVGNEHPTQKPVELFARPLRKHTRPRDVCYEPFCGSGSQLIAAESLGRRCYALEIEPGFVDVALRRWQATTGKEALLERTSQTFAQRAEKGARA